MLQCLSIKSPSATSSLPCSPPTINLHSYPPPSQGNSTDGSPLSSTQPSPTVNLTREYTLAVQTNSYNEIWSKIHVFDPNSHNNHHDPDQDQVQVEHVNGNDAYRLLLGQVLQPNRECVEDALRHAKPNTLTRLVSDYFDHSENTTHLCLSLHQSVYRARALYAPIHDLLDVLPIDSDSLTQSQCNWASNIFLQFDGSENPFPFPESHNFNEMRYCFSQLKQQLDRRLRKSRSRVYLLRRATTGSALCVIGSAVAIAISAVAIATHALVAIVATPLCTAYLPQNFTKKELAHVAQLDAAAKGTYVLNNDLDTIDRLVARLHTAVESDKLLIRLGLERGMDKHSILEVVKQFHKNHLNFTDQLRDLEEHICLCFNTVNRTRSLLLQEVHLHQTCNS